MWQYFSLYFLTVLFSFFDITNIRKAIKKYNLLIISIFLVVLAGFRYNTGADINAYRNFYNMIEKGIINLPLEKGYILINLLFVKLGLNFELLIFLISLVTITLISIFIVKNSIYYNLSILILYTKYFLRGSMGNIRQMLSMAILLFGYKYILNKSFFKFLFIVFLAASFHRVALIFVPFYFLLDKKYSKKQIITAIFLAIIISRTNFVTIIFTYLNNIQNTGFELGGTIRKVTNYYFNRRGSSSLLILGTFERLFWLAIFLFFKNQIEADNKKNIIYLNSYLYSLFIFFLLSADLHIASRISRTFQMIEIITIPFLLKFIKDKQLKVLIFIFLLMLYSLHFFDELFLQLPEYGGYVYIPYKSIIKKLF